jgi:transcriptional regulator with XRE-family HTH domain
MPDPDVIRAFGQRVRAARRGKPWTQEQLAEKTGLNLVQISRIERGVREVRLTTLLALISALEVEADQLLRDL